MGRNSCCVKEKLRKGLWSPEEDEKLHNYIARFGVGCWSSVPKLAGLQRCGKSCRLRWINYLRPDLKRGMFSQQEEDLILNLHQALGNRWAQIASQLPGRTDNEIKNFWNSSLKKKLVKQGIDPNTHKPVNETEAKDDRRDDAALHTSQPKALPIYLTPPSEVKPTAYNFAGKQVHNYDDPTPFLPGFQASLDPEYYYYHPESNFICQDLARSDYLHSRMEGSFDNSACGFNSMPALTHFDAANEGPSSTFCWDGQNKLDFSYYEEVTGANVDACIATNVNCI